ncbi:MAG: restriction endonuclease subunit S [Candidatus Bathyarchaeota archaeon]|nr:restriction endonuclease subunit S [Candidatus Bathyarchaeota archaeon]
MFVKETAFQSSLKGSFPKDWKLAKLGEIISLEYGAGLTERDRKPGPYPVIGSNGVVGHHNQALVKGPGIVVGRKGTIGAVTWVDSDFWPIDTTYYVKLNRQDIFLEWLKTELAFLNLGKLSMSDVVPGLKRDLAYSLQIPIPSLSEQRAIVGVLGVVDCAIELADRIIAKTERLKRGLMQQLLTRGIGHTETKQTPIGKIPKEWEVTELGKLGELQYGYTTSTVEENTGIKFLRITDIEENGSVDWAKVPYCNIPKRDFDKYSLKKGDILFARIGATAGKTALVNENICGVFASYLIRLKTNETVHPPFVFYFTQSAAYWTQALRQREGQLKKGINATMLSKFAVPLPPLEEQKRIAEILSVTDSKLSLGREEKTKLEQIKRGLMDLLLTGKVRIKVD